MPLKDLILSHFDANERSTVMQLLQQVRNILEPKLVQLSAEDRQRYGSIGEENKKLVNKVKDLLEDDPSTAPTEVDWQEFLLDYQDRRFLESVKIFMQTLGLEIDSTKILHDYDNYQNALTYYRFQAYRASNGVLNAAGKVEELKQFFPRTGISRREEETPE